MNALEVAGLGKRFGGVRALGEVSLAIAPGEVLGLVGENGAGKSTLIKIIGGVYAHGTYEGSVRAFGEERRFASARDALGAGVAVVHQELSLVPEMTVAENLMLGREPRRFGFVDGTRLLAEARAILSRTVPDDGIDPAAKVASLGVGRQQVVEIARALGGTARVIVLDEPTAALTESETARLFELVRAGRERGASFLYVSHRLDEIFALCDRVAVLRDGRLVGVRPTTETSRDELVALMTGKRPAPATEECARAVGDPMLAIRELSLQRGNRVVLDRVSLSVRAGEIVALAGAMGSGRTALLSALFGNARGALDGTMTLAGAPYRPRSPRDAIARGVALVPEDRKQHGLVLSLGVCENLGLASLSGAGYDAVAETARTAGMARDLGVKAPSLHAPIDTLSGGNQQKVVLGKWLLARPRLLLCDEPTRGVDVGARAEIFRILRNLVKRDLAVLVASSDLEEIREIADRVIVLREGRVAGELDGNARSADHIMQLAMGRAA